MIHLSILMNVNFLKTAIEEGDQNTTNEGTKR